VRGWILLVRHLRHDTVPAITSDAAHIGFMTAPGAHLVLRLETDAKGQPELLLSGNRSGLLSLANVLLWLHAMAWRRELLSLGELPFVEPQGSVALHIRVGANGATAGHGVVQKLDRGDEFEWTIQEDDLQSVGLAVHRLAANPDDEYTRLEVASGSAAGIHIRMADVREWL
jgi:hypothetical protein